MQPCATAGGSSRVTATLQNASYAFDATRRSTLHQQGENDASDNDGVSRSSRCSPLEGRRLPEIHPLMKSRGLVPVTTNNHSSLISKKNNFQTTKRAKKPFISSEESPS